MIDYVQLYNDPTADPLHNIFGLLDRGLNAAQINILRMLKSSPTAPTEKSINEVIEGIVHVALGSYIGSEYGDIIEAREGLPRKSETIDFINKALAELR